MGDGLRDGAVIGCCINTVAVLGTYVHGALGVSSHYEERAIIRLDD